MRPHRLVMTAFGPFAGEQAIDFDRLGDRGLFLIHGPTGAGKTTILDAICFALYGDPSGGGRESRHLRSHMADPGLLTSVVFEFSLGRDVYKVERRPKQQIRKKGSESEQETAHKAVLFKQAEINGGTQWKEIVSQVTGVRTHVQGLLGFESEQFRQVVLLPQGEFQRFLTANSGEREAILSVLFQSVFYERVQDALNAASKDLKTRVSLLEEKLRLIREAHSVDSFRDLETKADSLRENLEMILQQIVHLALAEKDALERFTQAGRIVEKLDELDDARSKLKKLQDQLPYFTDQRSILDGARRAEPLIDLEKTLQGRVKEGRAAAAALDRAHHAHRSAMAALEQAVVQLEIEKAREPERENARREAARLEEYVLRAKALEEAQRELKSADKKLNELERACLAAAERLAHAQTAISEKRGLLETEKVTAGALPLLQVGVEAAERNVAAAKKLEKLKRELSDVEKSLKSITENRSLLENSLVRAREEFEHIQAAWIAGQSSLLARELVTGRPCPVCGSTEHPSPAFSDSAVPDTAALRSKKREVDDVTAALEKLAEKITVLMTKRSEIAAGINALTEALGGLARDSSRTLEKALAGARTDMAASEAAGQRAGALEDELRKLEELVAQWNSTLTDTESRRNEASLRRQGAAAVVEERLGGIPEDLRAPGAVDKRLKAVGTLLEKLSISLKSAEDTERKCREEAAACYAAVQHSQLTLRNAEEAVEEHRARFLTRLNAEGFADEPAFRAALMAKPEMEALALKIRAFQDRLSAAEDRAGRAEQAAKGLDRPPIEALKQAAEKAAKDHDTARDDQARIKQQIESIKNEIRRYREIEGELDGLSEDYAVMGRVAGVANGANSVRLTFQRFVLRALLDDVLLVSSLRLEKMSQGRFSLLRSGKVRNRIGPGGLDLEVHDAYTGTARPVSTLSGGESFMASLALALGLADVVQSYSGGIRLDTIFIDEGFGSLDADTLEYAYRALEEIQKDGRLVGIISHVQDLKEWIPTRLEVHPSREGSKARFVVV
ncbi:MAG: AAA family ATPase [Pseudomonadota bacterium]